MVINLGWSQEVGTQLGLNMVEFVLQTQSMTWKMEENWIISLKSLPI